MLEHYKDTGVVYRGNRVFNNYAGTRVAEPTSVAIAATWHTLTRMLMQFVFITREALPGGRVMHPWESQDKVLNEDFGGEGGRLALSMGEDDNSVGYGALDKVR